MSILNYFHERDCLSCSKKGNSDSLGRQDKLLLGDDQLFLAHQARLCGMVRSVEGEHNISFSKNCRNLTSQLQTKGGCIFSVVSLTRYLHKQGLIQLLATFPHECASGPAAVSVILKVASWEPSKQRSCVTKNNAG